MIINLESKLYSALSTNDGETTHYSHIYKNSAGNYGIIIVDNAAMWQASSNKAKFKRTNSDYIQNVPDRYNNYNKIIHRIFNKALPDTLGVKGRYMKDRVRIGL